MALYEGLQNYLSTRVNLSAMEKSQETHWNTGEDYSEMKFNGYKVGSYIDLQRALLDIYV